MKFSEAGNESLISSENISENIGENISDSEIVAKFLLLNDDPSELPRIQKEHLIAGLNLIFKCFSAADEDDFDNLNKILSDKFLFDFILKNADEILFIGNGNLIHFLSQSNNPLKLAILSLIAANSEQNYQIFNTFNNDNLTATKMLINIVNQSSPILAKNLYANQIFLDAMAFFDNSITTDFLQSQNLKNHSSQSILDYLTEFKSRLGTQLSINNHDKIYANNLSNLIALLKLIHLTPNLKQVEREFLYNFSSFLIERNIENADLISDQYAKDLSLFITINSLLKVNENYYPKIYQLAEKLLYCGANPNFSCPQGNGLYQRIIFRVLEDGDHPDIINLLISYGLDIEQKLADLSLIETCARNRLIKSLELLIDKKPDLVNSQNISGNTPLMVSSNLAIMSSQKVGEDFHLIALEYILVSQILINAGSCINIKNSEGNTALDYINSINRIKPDTLKYNQKNQGVINFPKVQIIRKKTKTQIEEEQKKEDVLMKKIEKERFSDLQSFAKKLQRKPQPNILFEEISNFCQKLKFEDFGYLLEQNIDILLEVARYGKINDLIRKIPIENFNLSSAEYVNQVFGEIFKNNNEQIRRDNLITIFSISEIDLDCKKKTLQHIATQCLSQDFNILIKQEIFLNQLIHRDKKEINSFVQDLRKSVNSAKSSTTHKENFKKNILEFEKIIDEKYTSKVVEKESAKNPNQTSNQHSEQTPSSSKKQRERLKKEQREVKKQQEEKHQIQKKTVSEVQDLARKFASESLNQTISNFEEISQKKLLHREFYSKSITEAITVAKETSGARFLDYLRRDQVSISKLSDLSETIGDLIKDFLSIDSEVYLKGSSIYSDRLKQNSITSANSLKKINDIDLEIFIPEIATKENEEIVKIAASKIDFSKGNLKPKKEIQKNQNYTQEFANDEGEKITIFRQKTPRELLIAFTVSYSNPKQNIDITIYDSLLRSDANQSWSNSIDAQRIRFNNDQNFSSERIFVAPFLNYRDQIANKFEVKKEEEANKKDSSAQLDFTVNPFGKNVIMRSILMAVKGVVSDIELFKAIEKSNIQIAITLSKELKINLSSDHQKVKEALELNFNKHNLSVDDKIKFLEFLELIIARDSNEKKEYEVFKNNLIFVVDNYKNNLAEVKEVDIEKAENDNSAKSDQQNPSQIVSPSQNIKKLTQLSHQKAY